jgi:hypothetical protein
MREYIDRVFFDAEGYTGNTYYFRIIRRRDEYIWDSNAEEFAVDTSWANSVMEMSDVQSNGQYPVIIPEDFPSDTYSIVIYQQVGGSPANTDDIETSYETKVGSIFGF